MKWIRFRGMYYGFTVNLQFGPRKFPDTQPLSLITKQFPSMVSGENGSTIPKVNGHLNPCPEYNHNEKEMSRKSSWTALPDLLLTLFPTGILLTSGTTDGRNQTLHALMKSDRTYLACLLVLSLVFTWYEKLRSVGLHRVSILSSLVYSSVFPFTVSMGLSKSHSASSYTDFSFIMACANMWISCFNPTLIEISPWASIIALFHERWYLPTLLYITTFESISNTAYTSFNFEEVSLISHAVTHTLLYVSGPRRLSPHEIFLPALTFGIMVAITPAVPVLSKIRTSKAPTKIAIASYGAVVLSILVGVRPWIAAELSQDPVVWLLTYMISAPGYELRLVIVLWWIAVLAFGIIVPVKFFTGTSDASQLDNGESLNKRRKFFHGIVVLLFLPALGLDVHIFYLRSNM